MKLPLVVVEWWDACEFEGPATVQEARMQHEPELVTTIGWLLYEDEKGVSIANEFYDDRYRGRSFIPRAMVKDVTPFKLAKIRKTKEAVIAAGEQCAAVRV